MIYINPHSLTNVSFSTKIEKKKTFQNFFIWGWWGWSGWTCPPQNVFSYYSPTFNGDDHCRLTDWRQGEYRAICLWKMDFCNISLGLKRKETNYWGVRGEDRRSTVCQFLWQSVLREHCCSQSGGTHCCSQSHSQTVQPEWWEPLVVAVTAAAKVVAASV